MVAHILRLRVQLLAGSLRGDATHVLRVAAGALVVLVATAVACAATFALASRPPEIAFVVIVTAASSLTLSFLLAPLLLGIADPLDPRRFRVLALAPGRLAGALATAGLISVPTIALAALAVSAAVVGTAHGAPAAALGAVGAVFSGMLLARIGGALAALLREPPTRQLPGRIAMLVLVVVVPAGAYVASLGWNDTVPSVWSEAADVLAMTPLGAAWAVGQRGETVPIAIALATLATLAVAWLLLVRRLLTATEHPGSNRPRGGLGWFAATPATPGGAVAARSLSYWLRDGRYVANIVVIPVAAALIPLPLLLAGVPLEIVVLIPAPLIALFLGWLPHNDLAYDATALWMHIASGVRGLSDRMGRLVPVVVGGVPMLVVVIAISFALDGRPEVVPVMIGVCASLLLSGLGLSSISSAAAPYPVPPPGVSPFQQPQRTTALGAIAQTAVMLGAVALSAPAMWWAWQGLHGDAHAATAALWSGIAIGGVVLLTGILIGAAVFSRGGGRLMEFVESS